MNAAAVARHGLRLAGAGRGRARGAGVARAARASSARRRSRRSDSLLAVARARLRADAARLARRAAAVDAPPARRLRARRGAHARGHAGQRPAAQRWRVAFFDHADPDLDPQGLPLTADLPRERRRAAALRACGRAGAAGRASRRPSCACTACCGSLELQWRIGAVGDACRCYPNFAAVSRYAWLAGDRRLADIGIKTQVAARRRHRLQAARRVPRRRSDPPHRLEGDAASSRGPIVREFQDERDQRVIFLLDCGRRMRADEGARARLQPLRRGAERADAAGLRRAEGRRRGRRADLRHRARAAARVRAAQGPGDARRADAPRSTTSSPKPRTPTTCWPRAT